MKSIFDDNESVSSVVSSPKAKPPHERSLLMDYQTIKDYERLHKPAELARAVYTMEDEIVLIRRPMCWTKDGVQIPESRYHMTLEQVCADHGWKIVAQYGDHFAIVAPSAP